MATFLPLECRNCDARYALPDAYRPHIEGRMVLCPECRRSWIPLPGERDGGSIEPSKVDLRRFRLKPGQEMPKAPQAAPPAAPGQAPTGAPVATPGAWNVADAGSTMKIPTAADEKLTLRISVQGPGANLTGVFELGEKRFVIGRTACHLRLPKAAIPDHAIEIRSTPGGFLAEGIAGFPLILGNVSAPSAMVTPGQAVKLSIIPYQLELQTSQTPGSPVKDLSEIQQAAPQAPQAVGPPVPSGGPSAAPQQQGPGIQELAADVREQPKAFGGGAANLLEQVGGGDDDDDGDMTIADMGAMGLQAQSHNVDPLKGLEVALERADGPEQGQRFAITKTPLIIGRTAKDGLQIRDKRVSSKHAQLDIAGPWMYTLKDLASTNGTTVNGRPVSVSQLGDGDLISFGGVTFTFKAQKN